MRENVQPEEFDSQEVIRLLRLACQDLETSPNGSLQALRHLNEAKETIEEALTFVVDRRSGLLKWDDVSPHFDPDSLPDNVREALQHSNATQSQQLEANDDDLDPIKVFKAPLDWTEVIDWIDSMTIPPEVDTAMRMEDSVFASGGKASFRSFRDLLASETDGSFTEDDIKAAIRAVEELLSETDGGIDESDRKAGL